jgi:PhzF family phenazine biosynthesis protein
MKYYIVDAFTREAFGGNPAGVVLLEGDFPADSLMRQVAAELRYSETAFVQQNGSTEFTVRYFTPAGEVDLCGHATIATFGVLRQEGLIHDGAVCMNHTLAGDLEVTVGPQVMMQMAAPQAIDKPLDAMRLHAVMTGLSKPQWPDLPVEVISTGLPDIIMPVANVDALNGLNPDMVALTELSRELDVVGVHAFAIADDGYTAHVRNFAPLYDIPEESATGTANGALTHYLQRRGLITAPAECRFLQGEAMGRPSVITTILGKDGSIQVGGQSRIIAVGDLLV